MIFFSLSLGDFVSSKQTSGKVYLVGAGPGDPGLITVKGARLLELADVVVYDYLSSPRLLSYCPQAEVIYVGKKAAEHTLTQDGINDLLVKLGREGKRVVRLKGGDPYVFGRGGEEGEALKSAGIPFEEVPGITSAIAAPAYAGIPVTHRDFNSSFTLITGHEKEEEYKDPQAKARGSAVGSSDLDWNAIAKLPCVAFYMGVKALPRIIQRLIENGKDPNTPAATIQWGTTMRQKSVASTISNLVEDINQAGISSPAITIIGKVVSLRQTLNWFETRPLFGQTIIVTRTRQQASDLSVQLEDLGANVIEAPTIEMQPPANQREINAVFEALPFPPLPLGEGEGGFEGKAAQTLQSPSPQPSPGGRGSQSWDWIIFTSANGVKYTRQKLQELKLDVRAFGTAKIAAVGEATLRAIETELALKVDLYPQSFVAEALADALKDQIKGKRFLLLRADIARPVLRERLEQEGAAVVSDIAIYETKPATSLPELVIEAIDAKQVHWVTFTSSSTAKNFFTLLGSEARQKLAGVKIASIGPVTTKTLRELGYEPTVEATQFNLNGLVEAIERHGKR